MSVIVSFGRLTLKRHGFHLRDSYKYLDDLSDDLGDWSYSEALVSQQREGSDYDAIIDRPFRYGIAIMPNKISSGINSRFSDGTRFGVWYGSLSIITTIYETVHHWLRFLDNAGITSSYAKPIVTDRRVFKVRVTGILIDLRNKEHNLKDFLSGRPGMFRGPILPRSLPIFSSIPNISVISHIWLIEAGSISRSIRMNPERGFPWNTSGKNSKNNRDCQKRTGHTLYRCAIAIPFHNCGLYRQS